MDEPYEEDQGNEWPAWPDHVVVKVSVALGLAAIVWAYLTR